MTRLARTLLAALTSLTLLSASALPAFAVCDRDPEDGCPCKEDSQPDSVEAPCCCVVSDADGLPARESTQAPLRPSFELAGLALAGPPPALPARVVVAHVLPRPDTPRPVPPLHVRHCSLLI